MSIKIIKNKKIFNWKPVSEYTGGRVLATNDVDILVGYINSDGDCESEDCEGTLLCGITGFVNIEDILPSKKKERIFKLECPECETVFSFSESDTHKEFSRNLITQSIKCPVCGHYNYISDYKPNGL